MAGLLKRGAQWLADQQREHNTEFVYYRRGSSSIRVKAMLGRSQFEDTGEDGSLIRYESRDYLIDTELLVIDGIATTPQNGDSIVEGNLSAGYVYEMMPIPGEGVYRWADQYRLTYRIHTKFTGRIPAES